MVWGGGGRGQWYWNILCLSIKECEKKERLPFQLPVSFIMTFTPNTSAEYLDTLEARTAHSSRWVSVLMTQVDWKLTRGQSITNVSSRLQFCSRVVIGAGIFFFPPARFFLFFFFHMDGLNWMIKPRCFIMGLIGHWPVTTTRRLIQSELCESSQTAH